MIIPGLRPAITGGRRAYDQAPPDDSGVDAWRTVATATGRPAYTSPATVSRPGTSRCSPMTRRHRDSHRRSVLGAYGSPSEIPYRTSAGVPVAAASSLSSYTAASTQPPDTEPTTSPLGPTIIEAPGSRGDEPRIATTVPIPTVAPASHQRVSSGITSRTPHSDRDRLLPVDVPARCEGPGALGLQSRHLSGEVGTGADITVRGRDDPWPVGPSQDDRARGRPW